MKVLALRWLGIPAREYDATVGLFRDVLGLQVELEEPGTTELSLPEGDRVQLFAPGHRYFDLLEAPLALFEVDDVRSAREELAAAGVEIVGDLEWDSSWEWLHFRAPDGNLYDLASRRPSSARSA